MKYLMLLFFICAESDLNACTSVIISGRVTKDGRPLMWKQFDNEKQLDKKVLFLAEGKYPAMAVVNAGYKENESVWMGYNSKGFSIMSTDSGNLYDSIRVEVNKSGVFMKKALQNCASVEEFECFLKEYPKPHSFRVNFGVIDANGNGAYFETNNFTYVRYDVNDRKIAPDGYLIRTNYSFSGQPQKGHGYIRYKTAENLFVRRSRYANIDIHFLLDSVCLSLENSLTGQRLSDFEDMHENENHYMYFQDCINRYSTGAAAVIHGVRKGESPLYMTMWAIIGFPLTSIPIPVWLTSEGELPAVVCGEGGMKSLICNVSLQLKRTMLAAPYGDLRYYINTTGVVNFERTGIMQRFSPVRREVFECGTRLRHSWNNGVYREGDIERFYVWLDDYLPKVFQEIKK